MNKIIACLLIGVSLLTSCNKYVTYTKGFDQQRSDLATEEKTITIDKNYDYYIRTVYEVDSAEEKTVRSNIIQQKLPGQELIELEYLLLSKDHNKAIYISTITDQYQDRYEDRHDSTLSRVNVFDFKVLLFGRIDNNGELVFNSRNHQSANRWKLKHMPDGNIEVEAVIQNRNGEFVLYIPADRALKETIRFTKVKDGSVTYRQYSKNDPVIEPVFTGKIHFIKACKGKRKGCRKYQMFFPFDGVLTTTFDAQQVFLKNNRIGSAPEEIFD